MNRWLANLHDTLTVTPMRSSTMPFDISFKKLDLIALLFNDVFDQVTHRNNTNHFLAFKHR